VLAVLQKEAKRNELDLNMSVHDKLPTLVKGNGDRFKELIVYFTNKAFKRSTSATVNVFLIRTKKESSMVLIQVQDSGPGMSDAELDVCRSLYQSRADYSHL
jgi:signal transduction histidine kinase